MEIKDETFINDPVVHALLISQHDEQINKLRQRMHEFSNTLLSIDFNIKHVTDGLQKSNEVTEGCIKRLTVLEQVNKERIFKLSLFSRFINSKYTWIVIVIILLSIDHNNAFKMINGFLGK